MNFGDMKTVVSTSIASANSTLLPKVIQDVYERWVAAHRWAALEVSQQVNGQANVGTYLLGKTGADGSSGGAIAPDFGSPIAFMVSTSASTNPRKLLYLDQQTFAQITSDSPATGPPVFYTLRGGAPAISSGPLPGTPYSDLTKVAGDIMSTIEWWPVQTYVPKVGARYFRSVSSVALTNDTDVPILPVSTHLGICVEATAFFYAIESQVMVASQLRQEAQQMLQQAVEEDLRRRRGDNEVVDIDRPIQLRQPTPAQANPQASPYPAIEVEGQ